MFTVCLESAALCHALLLNVHGPAPTPVSSSLNIPDFPTSHHENTWHRICRIVYLMTQSPEWRELLAERPWEYISFADDDLLEVDTCVFNTLFQYMKAYDLLMGQVSSPMHLAPLPNQWCHVLAIPGQALLSCSAMTLVWPRVPLV